MRYLIALVFYALYGGLFLIWVLCAETNLNLNMPESLIIGVAALIISHWVQQEMDDYGKTVEKKEG